MPLAPITTFKVGGRADWLVHARTGEEIRQALEIARRFALPVTVLGGGSNVLIADRGLRGLVIRVHGGDVTRIDAATIRADGGVTINGLGVDDQPRCRRSRSVGRYARHRRRRDSWKRPFPGTTDQRAHRKGHARHARRQVMSVPVAEMEFGYDYSRLHRTREVVIAADFRVTDGEPGVLRATARESLAFRKRTQPLESASAGCIFQNPDRARDVVPDGSRGRPARSSIGRPQGCAFRPGTRVGHPRELHRQRRRRHCDGGQGSRRAVRDVHSRFGVTLREEIVYLGFEGDDQGNRHGHTQD